MKNTAVVILNWNGRQFLEIFLPMVVARTPGAEIWVADNASTDDSMNYLRENFPGVKTLLLDQNYGYTGGYNRALSQIQADYYVLLNSDIEVCAGWLEPLVEMLDADDKIAAVQPKILSFAEKTRFEYAGASGGFIDALGYPFCRGRFIGMATEFDKGQYDDAREIFWATGAAFVVRAEVFRQLGGLDENFFAHMEEIDLCWRMKRAGCKIMVQPQSVVYHVGGGTLPVWSPMKTYLNFRNNISMLYKNLATWRFAAVYVVRLGTDFLRFLSYAATAKWRFAGAIFRGHRDFWKVRKRLDRQPSLGFGRVGQVYRSSVILRQLLGRKTFSNMLTLALIVSLSVGCGTGQPASGKSSDKLAAAVARPSTKRVKPSVIAKYKHDTGAYTQGLVIHEGKLFESTGEYGRSTLRRVDLATGKVEKSVKLTDDMFGEGLAVHGKRLFQLTWMEQKCLVYDLATLDRKNTYHYSGEGWGLASDGGSKFYMSNGTNVITICDAATFTPEKTIVVADSDGPVAMINELEMIGGKLWANIYMTNLIAIIDPATGTVEKYIDCAELPALIGNRRQADVLNGIAVDAATGKIYVTGKNWDTLFEISI